MVGKKVAMRGNGKVERLVEQSAARSVGSMVAWWVERMVCVTAAQKAAGTDASKAAMWAALMVGLWAGK